MPPSSDRHLSPGISALRPAWNRLQRLPGGRRIFSFAIGRAAAYTGTIPFQVEELEEGRSVTSLRDRRGIRNHLKSIHAIALANFAEVTANVALAYSMPPGTRFIVLSFQIEYLHKARGRLRGIGRCAVPEAGSSQTYPVGVEIFDAADRLVCRATFDSLVGPE